MSYISSFKAGDFIIESPMFAGSQKRESRFIGVVNGPAKDKPFDINISFCSDYGSICKNHDSYDHFWNKANADDIKRFKERIDKNGYYYDEETNDIIKKDIEGVKELKERLIEYLKHPHMYDSDEKKCILRAVEKLL